MDVIDIAGKLASFDDTWNPRIVAELNGQQVKVTKLRGAFDWHHHAGEDELFWVVRGRLRMQLRDPEEREVAIGEGQILVVPRGVEHRPIAEEECHVVLFEPATTLNTGNLTNERTRAELERI